MTSLISRWKCHAHSALSGIALFTVFMCCLLSLAGAQQQPADSRSSIITSDKAIDQELPDSPSATTISGVVIDGDGDVVAGAQVTWTSSDGTKEAKTVTGIDGSFSFSDIVPGDFKLNIAMDGFASQTTAGTVHAREQYALPTIKLLVATDVSVQVVLSRHDQAVAEVKAEETQRLAGFFPNFYVTYNWHAAPLSTRQKYELGWKSTLDPANFIVIGAIAGVQQAQNDFSGYGQGAQGYAKRYAAALADSAVGSMVGGAILPSLLHQDPRYFYKGTGSIRSRLEYALAAAVICKGDNGRWQPNYSGVLGDLAAGGISNLYYPASDRSGVGLTFENGLLGIVGDAVGNVIQEFVFRKITPHLPQNSSARP